MNKRQKKFLIGLAVVILLGGMAVIGRGWYKNQTREAGGDAKAGQDEGSSYITYQGKKYTYNTDIRTLLFMGVDKGEAVTLENTPGQGGQSDTLLLLALDTKEKTAQVLEISRDTMTDIDIYDVSGEYLTTKKAQIALQYAYGNSTKRSCLLTRETVSKFLYETPVQSYLSLDVEGIARIVDAIGGVKITVPQDYTMIDPAFTAGSELVLNGSQAEAYVRYRDHEAAGSNTGRMERQNQFLKALMEQLRGIDSTDAYRLLTESAGDYLETNLGADDVQKLSEYTFSEEVQTIPGEMTTGEEHDEFVADDEKLYEIVLEMFYKPVS